MLKIGCCGFGQARTRYYERFPVVEVQKTFYQPPLARTLDRWRAEAPSGFAFTLKAWQPITHPASSPTWRRLHEPIERPEEAGYFRASAPVHAAWERTRDAARRLEARIVLFQCPASFTPENAHVEAMRRFFRNVDRDGLRFAWEPRGPWPETLVAELCLELDLIHCVDPLKVPSATAGTAYFRLHGVTGYRYRHTEDDLRRLRDLAAGYREAYCLFNNMSMLEDAERFRDLVAAAGR